MSTITFTIIAFLLGFAFSKLLDELSNKLKHQKLVKNINKQYKNILDNVLLGKTRFKTRVNNTVYITTKLLDYGSVDIIYLLDKSEVSVFKKDICIFTCELVEKELLNSLMDEINIKYQKKINNVVNIMGITISKEDLENSIKVNFDEINEKAMKMMEDMQMNTIIDQDAFTNQAPKKKDFNLDEILDKINKVGIENLTKDELKYLNDYNKK